jgi:anthrone oxygenase-like protein
MLTAVCLILLGLLAGTELIVRWGVQPVLAGLDDPAHLRARIGLVKRLKVIVPALIVPAVAGTVAHFVAAFGDPGAPARWAGLAALAAFLLVAAFGTIPINMRVDGWDPNHPPADWRAQVRRWVRLDVYRSSAAVLAFVLFTLAATV